MGEIVNPVQHEFWRPPMPAAASDGVAIPERSATCLRCGTEFMVSSRYCHTCGAIRPNLTPTFNSELPGLAELVRLGERLGLTTPAVIAFLAGVVCLMGALAVGVVFSARTVLDWQAIQLWRIEWLLASISAFAAGLLLKKSS